MREQITEVYKKSTAPWKSWGKSRKVCEQLTRPFSPGGHESVKGLARENIDGGGLPNGGGFPEGRYLI